MAMLLDEIPWQEPVLPPRPEAPEARARAKKKLGFDSNVFTYVASNPWVADAWLDIMRMRPVGVDPVLVELARFVTSQENSCRFCYGVTRTLLLLRGYPEKRIDAVERDMQLAELGSTERAAIDFCRQLARSNPRPARPEYEALLAKGVPRSVVHYLAFEVATWCIGNRIHTFLAVPPHPELEAMPRSPVVKLLRPLVFWAMGRAGEKLTILPGPVAYTGPYAELLKQVDGVPWTPQLAAILESAFERTSLGRRAALLTFAIVSRGLACPACEGEACRFLVAEGLPEEDVRAVLEHLASDRLTREEGLLVRFARNTVRYRVEHMQDEARKLAAELGPVATVDAVALCAIANGVARLAMLLHCR